MEFVSWQRVPFGKPQAITLVKRFERADYKVWNSDETNAKRLVFA